MRGKPLETGCADAGCLREQDASAVRSAQICADVMQARFPDERARALGTLHRNISSGATALLHRPARYICGGGDVDCSFSSPLEFSVSFVFFFAILAFSVSFVQETSQARSVQANISTMRFTLLSLSLASALLASTAAPVFALPLR